MHIIPTFIHTHPLFVLLNVEWPLIFSILNSSPDSFSDGKNHLSPCYFKTFTDSDTRPFHAVDIGGESTAPGRGPVPAAAEIERIRPAVLALASQVFVSVDTYKSETAAWALENGAQMINDVSALRADVELAAVIREHRAFVVLMYSKEEDKHPHATRAERDYESVLDTIEDFISRRIDYALREGIDPSRIVIDPGMGGFVSPNPKYSWEILAGMERFSQRFSGFPIMIGTSRKGFLGGELKERDPVSCLTALIAAERGAAIVRTHNPQMMSEFITANRAAAPGRQL